MVNENRDILVYVCHNCLPAAAKLPRQWAEGGSRVQLKEMPCTGKITTQYIFHALEGGSGGVCVITCPLGECVLKQGNYRAKIRMGNVKKLLAETGLEPERAEIIHFSPEGTREKLEQAIRAAVKGFIALGPNPVV